MTSRPLTLAYIPMMLQRRCLVIAAAAFILASAVGLSPAGTAGTQAPPPGTPAIPVLARFEVQQSRENPEPVARGAIHGVRGSRRARCCTTPWDSRRTAGRT
ncbi:MAG: hypothetical protein KY454_00510 [Actinobacteria bacterium]|nr:hypothetical protein [Actinomycetota bacterium]